MDLLDKLKILDMNPHKSGLLLVSQKEDQNISESERRILNIAEKDYKADAVYFRKFASNKAPISQIFIYDNSDCHLSDDLKREIHKRIWTSEIVPVYYIFENAQLLIGNGKKKIEIKDGKEDFDKTIADHLDLIKDIEQKYDALKHPYKSYFFDNGSFWDTDIYKENFITKESPFKLLIDYLKSLKKAISNNVTEDVLNRVIVQCILIKYLEEKKDNNGNNIFTAKTNLFKDKWEVDNFVGVIKKGKLIELLDYLSSHYNGKIFEWNKNVEKLEREEVISLPQETLEYLAAYFDGCFNFKTQSFSLWQYYSFQYLPVELISRIYEEFLPDMPGVVYTPPFLVDFLIDECMPIDDYEKFKSREFKVLDPSLGSGIFCVSAYKRLIDWYKINRYYEDGISWVEPIDSEILKDILKNNIYGIDVEKEAVRIAIFSLTLALLESLTPIQILEDLEFEDLGQKNIIHMNFFYYYSSNSNMQFDLVIGNPPFNPPNKVKNSEYAKQIEEDFNVVFSHKIPDDNLALLFLDRVVYLTKPYIGITCLILPSAPFLYGKWTFDYRTHFLNQFFVPQIIDFTHLRRILFNKDVSTIALFVKNRKPDVQKDKTWHVIANRTKKEQNRLFFLFDQYDFHIFPYKDALEERYVWKANLLGGGRLIQIISRLTKIQRTLSDYIGDQQNWAYGNGYIKGIKNRKNYATYITGNRSLADNSFTYKGIQYDKIFIEKEEKFKDPANENLFTLPLVLIKRGISKSGYIPIEKVDEHRIPQMVSKNKNILCFSHRILGIHYEPSCDSIIEEFIERFKDKTYSCFILLTSGEAMIRKETAINKTDIDQLPFPLNKKEIELSDIEKIWRDDVLEYYIHQAKSPENNLLNKIIDDPNPFLVEYGEVFCSVMNANYKLKSEYSFRHGESFETASYIATSFQYTDKNIQFSFNINNENEFEDYFNKQTGRNRKITRVVRYRHENSIWFIKPKLLRYWIKSVADRDAIDCINNILLTKLQKDDI